MKIPLANNTNPSPRPCRGLPFSLQRRAGRGGQFVFVAIWGIFWYN